MAAEAEGVVAGFIGDEWDRNLEAFCVEGRSPEEYVKTAKEMIARFALYREQRRMEKIILQTR